MLYFCGSVLAIEGFWCLDGSARMMSGSFFVGPGCNDGSSSVDVGWWWLFIVKMIGQWSKLGEWLSSPLLC